MTRGLTPHLMGPHAGSWRFLASDDAAAFARCTIIFKRHEVRGGDDKSRRKRHEIARSGFTSAIKQRAADFARRLHAAITRASGSDERFDFSYCLRADRPAEAGEAQPVYIYRVSLRLGQATMPAYPHCYRILLASNRVMPHSNFSITPFQIG